MAEPYLRRWLQPNTKTQEGILAQCRVRVFESIKGYRLYQEIGDESPLVGDSVHQLMMRTYDTLIKTLQDMPYDHSKRKMSRGFYRRAIDAAELVCDLQKDPQILEISKQHVASAKTRETKEHVAQWIAYNLTRSTIGCVLASAVEAQLLNERVHGIIYPNAVMEFAEMIQHNEGLGGRNR